MSVSIKRWGPTLMIISVTILSVACHDVESNYAANKEDVQFTSGEFEIHGELLTPAILESGESARLAT